MVKKNYFKISILIIYSSCQKYKYLKKNKAIQYPFNLMPPQQLHPHLPAILSDQFLGKSGYRG